MVFLENCRVIEIKSWNPEQAINMFHALNSLGMPLRDADIISAALFDKEASKTKSEVEEKWKNLLSQIRNLPINMGIDIDAILTQKMYINCAIVWKTTNGDASSMPGMRKYYLERVKQTDPVDLCQKLIELTEKWEAISDYLPAQILLKFNSNLKYFLACYMERYSSQHIKDHTDDLLPVIE